MSGRRIDLTATHPAEWLAALPVIVGYRLHHGTAITFTAADGGMVCTAAVNNGADRGQLLDAFRGQAKGLIDAGAVLTWTAVHDLDPPAAQARSRMLAGMLDDAGLPRPLPESQYAVDAGRGWPVLLSDPRPEQMWVLADHLAVADRLELLLGSPAEDRALVGTDLTPIPGELRDEIADALPAAAADPQAHADPARWRVGAAAYALSRLTDPQPWTGPSAARVLVALSDQPVLSYLLAHTRRTGPDVWLTPDSGQLAALVRCAPPGLVAGPATLLAGCMVSRGLTTSRARAAAELAVADRPDSTVAASLLVGLTRGQRPDTVMAANTGQPALLASGPGPLFAAGDGHWPDPLTSTSLDTPEPPHTAGPQR